MGYMSNEGAIDSLLVRFAGVKSPNEIAEMTGIAPEDVARRTAEILNSIDFLSIQQKRAKTMIVLEEIVAEVLGRIPDATDRNASGMLNSLRGTASTLLKELERMEIAEREDQQAQLGAYTRRFVEIVQRSYDRAIGELSAKYPEAGTEDITNIVNERILEVSREYDLQ